MILQNGPDGKNKMNKALWPREPRTAREERHVLQLPNPQATTGIAYALTRVIPSQTLQALDDADASMRLCQIDRWDLLRVFLQEGSYTYVWQEDGTDRGWVPNSYIHICSGGDEQGDGSGARERRDQDAMPWFMVPERAGEAMAGEGPVRYTVIPRPDGTNDGDGSVAARGMPQTARQLESWMPDVLISLLLQNGDWLRRVTEMLRVRWYFRPIAPICNAKRAASRQDLQNFQAGVFEAIAELQVGRRLLIHCIQGFHRTGVFLLLLLVARGYTTDAAVRRIHDIRYMTWYELAERWSWKKRPQTLLPKALNIVELVKNGWGDGECNIARGFDAERRTGRHKKYSASWDCRSCPVVANYPPPILLSEVWSDASKGYAG